MRARNVVREVFTRLAGLTAMHRRSSAFVCGDCERWQRCGLPPSDRCIVKAAELARGERPIKRLGLPAC
jgi:hypothetical protein